MLVQIGDEIVRSSSARLIGEIVVVLFACMPCPRGADIAAAGYCGEIVEFIDLVVCGECLHHAQCESGGAYPAPRKR